MVSMDHVVLPPGPKRPAFLQAASLAYRPYRFLESCRDAYGEAFTVSTPPLGPTPIFSHPKDVARIFELDGKALLGGAAQAAMVDFAGDRSLMKLDGPVHSEHRAILTNVLRPSDLPGGGAGAFEHIRRAVAGWPIGRRFDLGAALDRLALELVADVVLGGVDEGLIEAATRAMQFVRRASSPAGRLLSALIPWDRGPFGRIRRVTEDYLTERTGRQRDESGPAGRCVFARLATQRSSQGNGLGPDDVRDETMTLLTAMIGGLACSTKHALYWILRTPGIQSCAHNATAISASAGALEEIATQPYLDAVCKEILRLCPDIPFAVRRASTDIEIGPWRLPAGTTLGVGIYLLHRRQATYPEPDRFLPDRFLAVRPSRFEYLPFGGGRRGCVAAPLFVFLEKLILAAALERNHFSLCDRRDNPVTSMSLVSTPARPLWVVAERVSSRLMTTGAGTSLRRDVPPPDSQDLPGHPNATDPRAVRESEAGNGPRRRTGHECPARGAWQRG
jgi:cytochrome P450 family 110